MSDDSFLFKDVAAAAAEASKAKPSRGRKPFEPGGEQRLGVNQLATEFNVSRRTIQRWRDKDPSFPRPGSDDLYSLTAVQAWVFANNKQTNSPAADDKDDDLERPDPAKSEAKEKYWKAVERQMKAEGATIALQKLKGELIPDSQHQADMDALCYVFKTWLEGRATRLRAKLEHRTEAEAAQILDDDARDLGLALGQQREAIEIAEDKLTDIDDWLAPSDPPPDPEETEEMNHAEV